MDEFLADFSARPGKLEHARATVTAALRRYSNVNKTISGLVPTRTGGPHVPAP
jgi:hypothetical protein